MATGQRATLVAQAKKKMKRAQIAHEHVQQRQQQVANKDTVTAEKVHHGSPHAQEQAMRPKLRGPARQHAKDEITFFKAAKEGINKQHRADVATKKAAGLNPMGVKIGTTQTAEEKARAAARQKTGKYQAGVHAGEATPASIRSAERDRLKAEIEQRRKQLAAKVRQPDALNEKKRALDKQRNVMQRGPSGPRGRHTDEGRWAHGRPPLHKIITPEGPKWVVPDGYGGLRPPRGGRKPTPGGQRDTIIGGHVGPRPKPAKLVLRKPRRRKVQNSMY